MAVLDRGRVDVAAMGLGLGQAALGYLRGQRSPRTVRLLRDYVAWEHHPGLRRRGELLLRRMEKSLE